MDSLQMYLQNPLITGAISGFVSAAAMSTAAFRAWKSAEEAIAYDWAVAAWRWFQGLALGVLAAAGIGAMA